jgi:hypothetical protein
LLNVFLSPYVGIMYESHKEKNPAAFNAI